MCRIYWLSRDVKWSDRLRYASAMRLKTDVCPLKPDHSTQQRWQRPLKVVCPVVAMTDLEWTVYSDIIIRDDIAAAFRAARFSGAEYYPVELFTTTESPFGGRAVELRVFGWGGVAPPESGVRVLDECP